MTTSSAGASAELARNRLIPLTRHVRSVRHLMLAVAGLALLVCAWEATVRIYGLSTLVLPTPVAVLQQLKTMAGQHTFWHDVSVSLTEFAWGFAIGTVFGVVIGLAMGEIPRLRMSLHPVIESFRFVVPFAWIPLTVLWFGTKPQGKIFLVAYAVFFVMVVSTSEAIRRVNPALPRVATMLGMRGLRRAVFVDLRAAAPMIASAARASAAIGWIAVVAAEYIGASAGLGFMVIDAQQTLETKTVIAGMIVIGLIGALLSAAIGWLSRRWLSYR